jgi:outer membrane protein insertion porin family
MLAGKSFPNIYLLKATIAGLVISVGFSCKAPVIVKKYQPNKPFVYQTNINLTGNFSKGDRESLISRLRSQLDDSMDSRAVSKIFFSVMKTPPVYDSSNAEKSVTFMRNLLNKIGYFQDTITYTTSVKIVNKDQYRTTINFNVIPGKVVRLDSISYNIPQADLQNLTIANLKKSYLKKGDPFDQATISIELDRLVDLYRNNGYLRFSREELIGVWDTLDVSFLLPTTDIFEQLENLQKLKARRENPKANLEITLKPGIDTAKLTKYFVGNISVYPDFTSDTSGRTRKETMVDGVNVIYYRKLFKPKIVPQNIYFHRGEAYNQKKYYSTINRFNSLGSWRLINITPVPRKDLDTADFDIYLTPATKYFFTTNLEGSRNQSTISGNLFGLALNVGLQNRNFAKAANQTNTNARFGIELGGSQGQKFIQSQQVALSHNIYFPRPIPNMKWIPYSWRENFRTVFSFNAAYTDRKELYNLTTVNGSWGYESQNKKNFLSLRIPNVEYSYLLPRPDLEALFVTNPSLRNVFTDGFISSIQGGYTTTGGRNKNLNIFRANVEESGLLTGLLRNQFLDTNLYRYIKLDAEFSRKIQFVKTAIAIRFFAGVGYELNSTVNPRKQNNLPFFKQYFSGGPNSMRAWGLRQLGPGSTVKDFAGTAGIPERYGDVQLEGNIEYRFPIRKIGGVKVNGAIFTDVGNVWLLKKDAGTPEQVFNFGRLAQDLAVGAGAGLRIDFSFFVIRLDYSYKVKDPSPKPVNLDIQNKWFGYKLSQKEATQFQLGISYPFIL